MYLIEKCGFRVVSTEAGGEAERPIRKLFNERSLYRFLDFACASLGMTKYNQFIKYDTPLLRSFQNISDDTPPRRTKDRPEQSQLLPDEDRHAKRRV